MAPHTADGPVFANSIMVILVNQNSCAFLLSFWVIFLQIKDSNLSLTY